MSNAKKYWNSQEQLEGDKDFLKAAEKEFSEYIPVEDFLGKENLQETTTTRRDFLKFMGFSVAAATLAACETPVIKSIPYVVKPENITPGVANYYASTFFDGFDFGSVLIKTREGRPIFVEGNKKSTHTKGALNARINASVLDLYDTTRFKAPTINGNNASWDDVDNKVESQLQATQQSGGNVRILTNTIASPSTQKVINQFVSRQTEAGANVQHIQYDVISAHGLLEANSMDFGLRAIPDYKFEKAKVIVSVGSDFLNTWLFANKYALDYGKGRKPEKAWMSRHFHFEANMSLTGSNADVRGAIKPSEYGAALLAIYNEVAKAKGVPSAKSYDIDNDNNAQEKLSTAAKELLKNEGKGLLVCGSNDINDQRLVNKINSLLSNYGNTISWKNPVNIRKGSDSDFENLISELKSGQVDVLLVEGVNPVYTSSLDVANAIQKAKLAVSFSTMPNETTAVTSVVAPGNHYLESWNDYEAIDGELSLAQPTIRNLYKTRQFQASLMKWSGNGTDYRSFIKSNWEEKYIGNTIDLSSLTSNWKKTVHDGILNYDTNNEELTYNASSTDFLGKISKPVASEWEVQLYVSTALAAGDQANNPWLQELPDPLTRVTWDNYITMNPKQMEGSYTIKLAQETPATLADISINGATYTLPVVPQPGQKVGTVGIALGYGRSVSGKVGKDLGTNLYPAVAKKGGSLSLSSVVDSIVAKDETYQIASIQTHHTMMGRKIVNETTLDTFKNKPKSEWNADAIMKDAYGKPTPIDKLNLWEDHPVAKNYRWGMTIDLNTCFGCGACVVSCHSENNVPVVGKDEIRRTRSMSWIRIDRYFSSDADPKGHGHGVEKNYSEMEIPSEYPQTVYQPVMCQHCNHAPCETVCPVAATTHSNEGLNQMTYNRCIGTRYCANNCPYKVRRFNWFNYVGKEKFASFNPSQDNIGRMVLNPDVTVRARGVMEKCSLCIQNIQAAKLEAKKEGRKVKDGDVRCACSSACPADAISFGNLNDLESNVRKEAINDRSYNLLEEVGTQPNIFYQTKVRNVKEETTA